MRKRPDSMERDHAMESIRKDFIENLKMANVHLTILKEDVRYPLDKQRQKMLEGACTLIDHLLNEELKDEVLKYLEKEGDTNGCDNKL